MKDLKVLFISFVILLLFIKPSNSAFYDEKTGLTYLNSNEYLNFLKQHNISFYNIFFQYINDSFYNNNTNTLLIHDLIVEFEGYPQTLTPDQDLFGKYTKIKVIVYVSNIKEYYNNTNNISMVLPEIYNTLKHELNHHLVNINKINYNNETLQNYYNIDTLLNSNLSFIFLTNDQLFNELQYTLNYSLKGRYENTSYIEEYFVRINAVCFNFYESKDYNDLNNLIYIRKIPANITINNSVTFYNYDICSDYFNVKPNLNKFNDYILRLYRDYTVMNYNISLYIHQPVTITETLTDAGNGIGGLLNKISYSLVYFLIFINIICILILILKNLVDWFKF